MASQPIVTSAILRRAAQYVRMSTDQQEYSIANQSAAIALYAAAHNMGIVRSYVDAGKSGMTIDRRDALKDLIQTVQAGRADFSEILVYDVSRWGRFQDCDEAAHYEFICRKAGIRVTYCAEQFENDNSPASNLLKALKRMMAGEYSRELGVKVLAGQRNLVNLGFWVGGTPPYALRRMMVDRDRKPKGILEVGERKSLGTHVILVPGPADEVRTVRLIFRLFTAKYKNVARLLRFLNGPKNPSRDHIWKTNHVYQILRNPVYIGTNVFHRRTPRSGSNPKEQWFIQEDAFEPVVPKKQFEAAQRLLRTLKYPTHEEILEGLRRLWKREGKLSSKLIYEADDVPYPGTVANHFGSLVEAYERIGYFGCKNQYGDVPTARIDELRSHLQQRLASHLALTGGTLRRPQDKRGSWVINESLNLRVVFAPARANESGELYWRLYPKWENVDLTIVVRLTEKAQIQDFYILPRISELRGEVRTRQTGSNRHVELFRSNDLEPVLRTLAISRIPEEPWSR